MKNQKLYEQSKSYFAGVHTTIKKGIEKISGEKFKRKKWDYSGDLAKSGGGISLSLESRAEQGKQVKPKKEKITPALFEKAGLNLAGVEGKFNPQLNKLLKKKIKNFKATGVSLVFHPTSPKVPTIHMNLRFFLADNGTCWLGGGIDLTPYFPYEEDFSTFHGQLKKSLDAISPDLYPKYKKEADEYFYLPHRQEMRGIGGVFIDYLEGTSDKNFSIIKALGDSFLDIYLPLVEKRSQESYEEVHKEFQLLRRGRYIEFNLLYDRGTKFGLLSGGRIESILMSLPPQASYPMNSLLEKNDFVKRMNKYYQPKNWVKVKG